MPFSAISDLLIQRMLNPFTLARKSKLEYLNSLYSGYPKKTFTASLEKINYSIIMKSQVRVHADIVLYYGVVVVTYRCVPDSEVRVATGCSPPWVMG